MDKYKIFNSYIEYIIVGNYNHWTDIFHSNLTVYDFAHPNTDPDLRIPVVYFVSNRIYTSKNIGNVHGASEY